MYGKVQCIMGNGHWDTLWTHTHTHTHTTENITSPQLPCRAVITLLQISPLLMERLIVTSSVTIYPSNSHETKSSFYQK